MQGLFEAVNRNAAAVRINASNTKVMSALIPGELRQAVLPYQDKKQDKYSSFRILSPAILSLVVA